jgi:hypothetical protein
MLLLFLTHGCGTMAFKVKWQFKKINNVKDKVTTGEHG